MSMWPTSTARALTAIQYQLTQLTQLLAKVNTIMTALDNLQAADTALKAEVTTAITDWAAALAAAVPATRQSRPSPMT